MVDSTIIKFPWMTTQQKRASFHGYHITIYKIRIWTWRRAAACRRRWGAVRGTGGAGAARGAGALERAGGTGAVARRGPAQGLAREGAGVVRHQACEVAERHAGPGGAQGSFPRGPVATARRCVCVGGAAALAALE
jgi:hypothetical protein